MNSERNALPRGTRVLPAESFPWLTNAIQLIDDYREHFRRKKQFQFSYNANKYYGGKNQVGFDPLSNPEHFYPVISIGGGRGTGKSSAMLTLLNEFIRTSYEKHNDIVLTPIDPNRFVSRDKLIYWFMAELNRIYVQIKERLTNAYNYQATTQEPLPDEKFLRIEQRYDALAESLFHLFKENNTNDASDLDNRFRAHYLASGISFSRELNQLVNDILELHCSSIFNPKQDCDDAYPLMILPIDDADLVPEYLDDLLQFLRVVALDTLRLVTITTIDFDVAATNRKLHYFDTVVGDKVANAEHYSLFSEHSEVLCQAEEMSHQFLTKFFPLEGRFNLLPFSNQDKLNYFPVSPFGSQDELANREALVVAKLLSSMELDKYFQTNPSNNTEFRQFDFVHLIPDNPRLLEEFYFEGINLYNNIQSQADDNDASNKRIVKGFDWICSFYAMHSQLKYGRRSPMVNERADVLNIIFKPVVRTQRLISVTNKVELLADIMPVLASNIANGDFVVNDGLHTDAIYYLMKKEAERYHNAPAQSITIDFGNLVQMIDCRMKYGSDMAKKPIPLIYYNQEQATAFPMPPWEYPLSWITFNNLWTKVVEIESKKERPDLPFLLSNLVYAICFVCTTDLLKDKKELIIQDLNDFGDIIFQLQTCYKISLHEAKHAMERNEGRSLKAKQASSFAYWFEFGLLPFLHQAEIEQLTVEKAVTEIFEPIYFEVLQLKKTRANREGKLEELKNKLKAIYAADAPLPMQSLMLGEIQASLQITGLATARPGQIV